MKVPTSRDVSADIFNLPALQAKVLIFDVDHTITRRSTGVRMSTVGFSNKTVPLSTIIRFPFYFLRYRFGNYTVESLPKELDPLVGIPKTDLDIWGQTTFDKHIEEDIYPAALALIRRLNEQGKKVVLATSSLDFVIRPLADFLGVTDVISTEVEVDDNGISTGRIKGLPAFRDGKVAKTKEFLESQGINFADAAFFSDSHNDLPLLSIVGWPVPTNPDNRLLKVARANSWNTIKFRT